MIKGGALGKGLVELRWRRILADRRLKFEQSGNVATISSRNRFDLRLLIAVCETMSP